MTDTPTERRALEVTLKCPSLKTEMVCTVRVDWWRGCENLSMEIARQKAKRMGRTMFGDASFTVEFDVWRPYGDLVAVRPDGGWEPPPISLANEDAES